MDYESIIEDLNNKYSNVKVLDINDSGSGSVSMEVAVGQKELAYLTNNSVTRPLFENAAISSITRDPLVRGDLDLAETSVLKKKPADLFQTSIDYYYTKDVYGTVIRNLSNFASNGFENDIDDDEIRNFFDNWAMDIGLDVLVEQIFFDFFRVGMVRTYKVLGKYEPKINTFKSLTSGDSSETAARKRRWSKTNIPVKYTVLNPVMLEISGSMLFDQTVVTIKPEALKDLKELLETKSNNLTSQQKEILKAVPSAMKKAALSSEPYALDMDLVGEVDYRKQPYDRYPKPRGINAFESIEYKNRLRQADLSTLDGITNQILKITVGNDEFPVTNNEVLENVAELFNTPSKAYNVVWNHTLSIEKIVSPEIEAILGKDKYEQVNEDYTGALGFVRALIDGGGDSSSAATELAMKSVISEIAYARRQVRRWLYKEYRDVAEAVGFDRYPVVRFNDLDLRDEVDYMRAVLGMVDRRAVSYETALKKLGLDADTEMKRLESERDRVLDGSFGIIGSPYQAGGGSYTDENVQPNQRTPSGTPSEGRPPGSNKKDDAFLSSKVSKAKSLLERMTDAEVAELAAVLNEK